MDIPSFSEAMEKGRVVSEDGYHKPDTKGKESWDKCGCDKTTRKGAYRDVTIQHGENRIHFYHQSPVVVETPEGVRVSSCGWKTDSTKERINRYLPPENRLIQEDGDWYVTREKGDRVEFRDNMVIKNYRIKVSK